MSGRVSVSAISGCRTRAGCDGVAPAAGEQDALGTDMARKVVGWFAVVAGLLLAVHMGYKVVDVVQAGSLTAQGWARIVIAGLLAGTGGVVVVFGLRRLQKKGPTQEQQAEAPPGER